MSLAANLCGGGRHPGVQPGWPRLPDLRAGAVPPMPEGRAPERGIRPAAAPPPALVRPGAQTVLNQMGAPGAPMPLRFAARGARDAPRAVPRPQLRAGTNPRALGAAN